MKNKIVRSLILILLLITTLTAVVFTACNKKAETYFVVYIAGEHGTISGETEQNVESGKSAQTVIAVPDTGYRFVEWSDGIVTASRTDTNVTEDINVTAEFAKIVYEIYYVAGGNGKVVGETYQTVEYGSSAQTVTAVPDTGYRFVKWSDGNVSASRTDTNVTEDINVTAIFEKITFTVQYLATEGGSIQGNAIQTVGYLGETQSVMVRPNNGYEFVQWSDGRQDISRKDTNVIADISVTAEFRKRTHIVQYLATEGGTIQGDTYQTIEHGSDTVTVTAVPDENYEFIEWSDGVQTATRTDTNVISALTVTAKFRLITHVVTYEVNYHMYGLLKEDNDNYPYPYIRLKYNIPHGEDAPLVYAYPNQSEYNENYVFLYWSDGLTTEERQDTNITEDITITAYFGFAIKYAVNNNVGGRIEGNVYQKLLSGEVSEEVTAVPNQGYVFCGWSDLSLESSRSGDTISEQSLVFYATYEYVAYFEPIEKTLRYNYGIANGNNYEKEITLNRNAINNAKFTVPEYEGYTFCGWYADNNYSIRITDGNGRYMYGYAAFSLDSDTLYARWQKQGEETNNHKILIVYVDEVQTELYSTVISENIKIHSKMLAIEYEMSKWLTDTINSLLNEWFEGNVVFEVDAYYTTMVVEDGFKVGRTFEGNYDYSLYADSIKEISSSIAYEYHNTITVVGIDDYNHNLWWGAGTAGVKNACVYREYFFSSVGKDHSQKYLERCKNGEIDLNDITILDACLHELAHTAEGNFDFDYDFHTIEGYSIRKYRTTNIFVSQKPYLLGEFEYEGVKYGIPMEYWKHKISIHIGYGDQPLNGNRVGKIVVVGEIEDPDRKPWESYISRYVVYGSDFSVEAVPYVGYRFVKWTDGIETAIRHDTNIIAFLDVGAIFEVI